MSKNVETEMHDQILKVVQAVEELARMTQTWEYRDAVETIFNNGIGCSTYPFDESFEEVAYRVSNWVTK